MPTLAVGTNGPMSWEVIDLATYRDILPGALHSWIRRVPIDLRHTERSHRAASRRSRKLTRSSESKLSGEYGQHVCSQSKEMLGSSMRKHFESATRVGIFPVPARVICAKLFEILQ
jgi:hypothetical protein